MAKKQPPNAAGAPDDEPDWDESAGVHLPAVRTGMGVPAQENPAVLAFPPMLPIELAMGTYDAATVCEAYGIDRDQFQLLCEMPLFRKAYDMAVEMLEKEGATFRVKAKMQAEILLDTAYKMAHNVLIPANVRAEMIKCIVRWAEYEPKKDAGPGNNQAFQININLA